MRTVRVHPDTLSRISRAEVDYLNAALVVGDASATYEVLDSGTHVALVVIEDLARRCWVETGFPDVRLGYYTLTDADGSMHATRHDSLTDAISAYDSLRGLR